MILLVIKNISDVSGDFFFLFKLTLDFFPHPSPFIHSSLMEPLNSLDEKTDELVRSDRHLEPHSVFESDPEHREPQQGLDRAYQEALLYLGLAIVAKFPLHGGHKCRIHHLLALAYVPLDLALGLPVLFVVPGEEEGAVAIHVYEGFTELAGLAGDTEVVIRQLLAPMRHHVLQPVSHAVCLPLIVARIPANVVLAPLGLRQKHLEVDAVRFKFSTL